MAKIKQAAPPLALIAAIDRHEPSYFISEQRGHRRPVSDEGLLEIVARIERISPALAKHKGEELAVTLACAQSFSDEGEGPSPDTPALFDLTLKPAQRSTMAYLPVAAFWHVARLIGTGAFSHIEVMFERLRYGRGAVTGLYFLGEGNPAKYLASGDAEGPWA